MPPYYTYGLSLINTHLFVGGSILINNLSAFDKNFWKIIKEKKKKLIVLEAYPFFMKS